MAINRDFRDLFFEFTAADVRFLVIGAHAVIYYTVPRYTKDLDVWIDPVPDNAARAYQALARFGAPLDGVAIADLHTPGTILQIGVEPNRIDVLTEVEGLPSFPQAWEHRELSSYGDAPIGLLQIDDLIASKKAAGRLQDQLDLEWLEKRKAKS